MMSIAELLSKHRRLALDSNLFIYLFEAGGSEARTFSSLLDAAEGVGTTLIVSSLALAEVTVGPAAIQDEVMADRYVDAIRSIRGVTIVPMTAEIAIDAGLLRGRAGCSQADAIYLATARQAGAAVFVTNDRRIRATPHVDIVQLANLVA